MSYVMNVYNIIQYNIIVYVWPWVYEYEWNHYITLVNVYLATSHVKMSLSE